MSKTTVCIIYGINEGPVIAKPLLRALEGADFTLTADAVTANVIFAHSGGCFLIPPHNQAKLIVFVGMAYWPHRLWLLAVTRKLAREARLYYRERQLGAWGRKLLCNVRYINPYTALRMLRNRPTTKSWNSTQPQVIVRNRSDVFCCPDVHIIPFRGPRTFISLPGEHDDCWDTPERYVSLIQSLL